MAQGRRRRRRDAATVGARRRCRVTISGSARRSAHTVAAHVRVGRTADVTERLRLGRRRTAVAGRAASVDLRVAVRGVRELRGADGGR